jgi:hypothetical protein
LSLRWKVFYQGGSIYSAADGSAFDAPARGVLMIANSNDRHGWALCRSNDYYWWLPEDDAWQGGDIFGLWDYLIEPGPKKVLFGRTVSNAEFEAVLMRAHDDPDIPQKTGWMPGEREAAGVKN